MMRKTKIHKAIIIVHTIFKSTTLILINKFTYAFLISLYHQIKITWKVYQLYIMTLSKFLSNVHTKSRDGTFMHNRYEPTGRCIVIYLKMGTIFIVWYTLNMGTKDTLEKPNTPWKAICVNIDTIMETHLINHLINLDPTNVLNCN